jgi:hypothetical protein
MADWLDEALTLCRQGTSMAEAARRIGVSRQRVHQAFSRYARDLEDRQRLVCMGLVHRCLACGEEFRRKAGLQDYCCYRCRDRSKWRRKSVGQDVKSSSRIYRNVHSANCSRLANIT